MASAASPNAMAKWLNSSTKLSKVIAAVLTAGYLVQLIYGPTREYLAMVAGRFVVVVA